MSKIDEAIAEQARGLFYDVAEAAARLGITD